MLVVIYVLKHRNCTLSVGLGIVMAEVIDICFIDKNPEQYKSMLDIFQSYFGKSIDACSAEIMDNWEYSN